MCYGKNNQIKPIATPPPQQQQKEWNNLFNDMDSWLQLDNQESQMIQPQENTATAIPLSAIPLHTATTLPLPLIDEQTLKAQIKRQKNTEAARQSRKRKNELMKGMEEKISSLEDKNVELERDNAILKSENCAYEKRIECLERQVDELHGVLIAMTRGEKRYRSESEVVVGGEGERKKQCV